MLSLKKFLFVATAFILSIVALYAYKEYNRRPADLSTIKPDVVITAEDLVNAFETDEAKANTKYNGKTLMVNGVVAEINNQQDTLLTVYLGKSEALHKVSCTINTLNKEKKKQPHTGDNISVKGKCTGFLLDVEMNRCVFVND